MTQSMLSPVAAAAHLQPEVWAIVNRRLVTKALAELAHELLIEPALKLQDGAWGHYVLITDHPEIAYRFRAQRLALEHWQIDPASVQKLERGQSAALDALSLFIELRERLALSPQVLPEYLEELASTLYAAAYKHVRRAPTAEQLTRADFQTIEAAMSEGHPCFVANSGRIGWSAFDYARYAPEAARETQLLWLAARTERAELGFVSDLDYGRLVERELGAATLERFARVLRERGLEPHAYRLLPVHPWQWDNRLAQLFAADLAAGDLVYLGPGEDRYQAQQSIRTFFNLSRPDRFYVKTALSILNMGFTRGIPSSLPASGAAVNDWVARVVERDPYFSAHGFRVLREVAFISYRHSHYEAAISLRSHPYKEMLGALWRESPCASIGPSERLMTMAALMHVDAQGTALLPLLIRASGLSIDAWLARYLKHYLKPLLHAFYAYNLTFTPHCENTILVLDGCVPVGVMLKDLAEDIGVLNPEQPLPENVERLALAVPDAWMTLAIFTDVFDCVFRFLAPILHTSAQYPEQRFWRAVADCIHQYQDDQPQLRERFVRYDLFAPRFARNCLNRLQLRNNRLMIDLNAPEPADSLQLLGTLQNPIAAFGRRS